MNKIVWCLVVCIVCAGCATGGSSAKKALMKALLGQSMDIDKAEIVRLKINAAAENIGLSPEDTKLARAIYMAHISTQTPFYVTGNTPLGFVSFISMLRWFYDNDRDYAYEMPMSLLDREKLKIIKPKEAYPKFLDYFVYVCEQRSHIRSDHYTERWYPAVEAWRELNEKH